MSFYRKLSFYGIVFFLITLLISGCGGGKEEDQTENFDTEQVKRDYPAIEEEGVLRAITIYSSTSYFLYRGQPMGYEYELLQRLADHLNLELEIVVAKNLDNEIKMLNSGKGDLIAHGLTVTKERKKRINFTRYHTTTHQALVQKKPDNWRSMKRHEIENTLVTDALDLIGKTVHVRKNSSYYQRLLNLEEEIGGDIDIVTVKGTLTTEDLIKKVADGEIEYTIADYNIASINQTYYPILNIDVPFSFFFLFAWAVRNSSPVLLEKVNEWIALMRQKTDYYVIYNKYFKNKKSYKRRIQSPLFSPSTGKISEYDPLIRDYSGSINWDWRLLASLIYQESRFDPDVKSWAGAVGLMQLMPSTAQQFGVSNLYNPKANVRAGTAYIDYLKEFWKEIPDSSERIKFVMASYNVGQNHVADARRLAEKHGRDPNLWDENTAYYLLQKSKPEYYNDEVVKYGYCRGDEPYEYVREILQRYDHYKRFAER